MQILSWIWNGLLNNEHIHFKRIMFLIGLNEIYSPFVFVIPKSMGSRPMVYAKNVTVFISDRHELRPRFPLAQRIHKEKADRNIFD